MTQSAATAPKHDKPVSTWEIAAFALPAAPLLALTLPTLIFLPPHFAQHIGLPLWAVSLSFFCARILDVVFDPFIGGVQDRTVTRFGRRRFWMLASLPPLMFAIWLAFMGLQPGAPIWMAIVSAALLYSSFACLNIVHLSWAGELIPTYHGRTRVLGWVQGWSMLGQVGVLALAAYVVQGLHGSGADAVVAIGLALLIAFPLTSLIAVLFTRDNRSPPQHHVRFSETLRLFAQNKNLRRVLFTDLLVGGVQGLTGGLFLFYFQTVLNFESESQTLLFFYFIGGLLGVPLWAWLGKHLGKHKALQLGCLYWAATTLILPFVPPGVFNIAAPLMFIGGVAQSTGVLLLRAMMADVVDEDEVETGARRSGLFFGLLLTTTKLGMTLGPLSYLALDWSGFDAEIAAANTPLAIQTLSVLFIAAPVSLLLGAIVSLRNYPLDEARQAELANKIRAQANSDQTPAESL